MNGFDCDLPFEMSSEALAPAVHEFYREFCHGERCPVRYHVKYEDLPDGVKADNGDDDQEKDRNAVRHYPDIVELADCKIVEAGGPVRADTR